MIIKKFQGSSEVEAFTKAKEELGSDAVIMNVKTIKPRGISKLFKATTVEVTAALEETDNQKSATKSVNNAQSKSDNINIVADEPIVIKPQEKRRSVTPPATKLMNENNGIEERLESLQQLLEKQLSSTSETESGEKAKDEKQKEDKKGNLQFVKMIYNIMIENEIDEKYANQIIEEIEKIMRNDTHIDYLLSNIYQKMILKFGKPTGIKLVEGHPKVVFFIGPTGVGKTTTVAKLASLYKIEQKKEVAFLTADTYRIAATEQLRTYANIINAPLSVVYTPEEIKDAIEKLNNYDLILVDTAGYSHKNSEQQQGIKMLLDAIDDKYEKEVYLVISATTKYNDLKNIADAYSAITDYKIIFTKLDETSTYGNIFNMKMYTGAELSYATDGQNVPDDVEIFNSQKAVKLLLGGKQ